MLVNADFSQLAIVTPDRQNWVHSPGKEVERVMLDRLGGESGRATSLVRYRPGAGFPRHGHPGGEEILVLSGTFSDEHASYPAGWYLRNPPGSQHQPHSRVGAVIFVKLWQMQPTERGAVRIDTRDPRSWQHRDGQEVCSLFDDGVEATRLQSCPPGAALAGDHPGGCEILVLRGELIVGGAACASRSWIRLPPRWRTRIDTGAAGATVYVKTGHLGALPQPA